MVFLVTENCIIHIWQHHLSVNCQLTLSVLSTDNYVFKMFCSNFYEWNHVVSGWIRRMRPWWMSFLGIPFLALTLLPRQREEHLVCTKTRCAYSQMFLVWGAWSNFRKERKLKNMSMILPCMTFHTHWNTSLQTILRGNEILI